MGAVTAFGTSSAHKTFLPIPQEVVRMQAETADIYAENTQLAAQQSQLQRQVLLLASSARIAQ